MKNVRRLLTLGRGGSMHGLEQLLQSMASTHAGCTQACTACTPGSCCGASAGHAAWLARLARALAAAAAR